MSPFLYGCFCRVDIHVIINLTQIICLDLFLFFQNIDLESVANETHRFTGSDLGEICQRACRLASQESIKNEISDGKNRDADPDALNVTLMNFHVDNYLSYCLMMDRLFKRNSYHLTFCQAMCLVSG